MRRIKSHTIQKLEYLDKYINAFVLATKKFPARCYIDVFAGTGKCKLCDERCDQAHRNDCGECPKGGVKDGSAIIALKSNAKYDRYILNDIDKNCLKKLKAAIGSEFGEDILKRIKFCNKDAEDLSRDITEMVLPGSISLILLDPEGPELSWQTIVNFSLTRADIIILYPYDMSLVRLANDYPEKLDKFYGDTLWRDEFGKGTNASDRKQRLLDLYIDKIKALGFRHVIYKQIRRGLREGKPLYHLLLATRSDIGKKIMYDIFDKELDGQTKMKF